MSLIVDWRLERMSLLSDSLTILLSFMIVHICAKPFAVAMSRGVSPFLFFTSNVAPLWTRTLTTSTLSSCVA